MRVEIEEHSVVISREPGDPTFYGERNAAGESRLLYWLKNELNSRGWDLIKKRMWKDGHLVDDMQQYLRSRKVKNGTAAVMIYNTRWSIESAGPALMRDGKVRLRVEHWADRP